MIYRVGWSIVAVVLGLLGVASAVVMWRFATLFSTALMAAVVATAFGLCRSPDTPKPAGRTVLRAAGCAGVVVASAGLCTLLGAAGVLLVLLMAVSSPWVIRYAGGPLRTRFKSSADDDGVSAMTTLELCRVWVATGDQLRTCLSPELRLRLANARQLCLDELERRDPDGVAAWLASANASAAGDPHRFLQR